MSYQPSPTVSSVIFASLVAATPSVTHVSSVNDSKLVFNGNVLTLALFACFVLLSLHRAFFRFCCVPERLQGHLLWYTNPAKWRNRRPPVVNNGIYEKSKHSQTPHPDMRHWRHASTANACSRPRARAISSIPILHPIMSTRISPGFSLKHTVVPGVYGAILLYESIYKSNIFTNRFARVSLGRRKSPSSSLLPQRIILWGAWLAWATRR